MEASRVVVLSRRVIIKNRRQIEPLTTNKDKVDEEQTDNRREKGAVVGQEIASHVVELCGPENKGEARHQGPESQMPPGSGTENSYMAECEATGEDRNCG